jgi:hypothetical protein
MTPVTQVLKSAQFVIARQALYPLSRLVRAAPDTDASDVLIKSLHCPALIPERKPQLSSFLQTSPAMSGPPAPQPAIPTASRRAAAAVDTVLGIVRILPVGARSPRRRFPLPRQQIIPEAIFRAVTPWIRSKALLGAPLPEPALRHHYPLKAA